MICCSPFLQAANHFIFNALEFCTVLFLNPVKHNLTYWNIFQEALAYANILSFPYDFFSVVLDLTLRSAIQFDLIFEVLEGGI